MHHVFPAVISELCDTLDLSTFFHLYTTSTCMIKTNNADLGGKSKIVRAIAFEGLGM